MYARGLLRRLVTNIVNKGLILEATPNGQILGLDDEALNEWAEQTEAYFYQYANNPALCDYTGARTLGQLQRLVELEALAGGDLLVMRSQSAATGLPRWRTVSGSRIESPFLEVKLREGHTLRHGVELDAEGRQVAYYVRQADLKFKRVAAYGPRSRRRLAWLVYGTERRVDDVRGEPLLASILQSLKELDRYRDATQRKAVINSILAMFIKKGEDKPGTKPLTGGAVKRTQATVTDTTTGDETRYNFADHIPGFILETLQQGEEPVGFNTAGADINYGEFEAAVISAIAWANEIPPEILQLAFRQNYSASRGAVNEFKLFLDKARSDFAESFLEPIYRDWLISMVLTNRIEARGLLQAWRDPNGWPVAGAWFSSDWTGAIKPAVDLKKEVDAYDRMAALGFISRDRGSKELTGTKFSKNVVRLKTENSQLAEALRPILELRAEFGSDEVDAVIGEGEPGTGMQTGQADDIDAEGA